MVGRLAKWAMLAALALPALAFADAPDPLPVVDLSPLGAPSAWHVAFSRGPGVGGDQTPSGTDEPGEITLCLRKSEAGPCDPALATRLAGFGSDYFEQPHYVEEARIVRGAGGRPLLLVRTASVYSGDSDQLVYTQVLAYHRQTDRFVRVYAHGRGHNNNQEDRFVETGPLKGDIISVDQMPGPPFNFWITVNAPGKDGVYRQILRFGGATHYGDGNPLAVIDSDMPLILQHLGLWKPGRPLPLPAGPCPKPHLVKGALWCQ